MKTKKSEGEERNYSKKEGSTQRAVQEWNSRKQGQIQEHEILNKESGGKSHEEGG